MQSVSDDEKTCGKATFWAGSERCIQTSLLIYDKTRRDEMKRFHQDVVSRWYGEHGIMPKLH